MDGRSRPISRAGPADCHRSGGGRSEGAKDVDALGMDSNATIPGFEFHCIEERIPETCFNRSRSPEIGPAAMILWLRFTCQVRTAAQLKSLNVTSQKYSLLATCRSSLRSVRDS